MKRSYLNIKNYALLSFLFIELSLTSFVFATDNKIHKPSGGWQSIYKVCKDYFLPNNGISFTEDSQFSAEILADFLKSDRLIYQQKNMKYSPGKEFYLSNEFDLANMDIDIPAADLVIGVATNTVWDLQIRSNAKEMIIADIAIGPLLVQEYLFRSIFYLAETRAEFLNLLVGNDLRSNQSNYPYDSLSKRSKVSADQEITNLFNLAMWFKRNLNLESSSLQKTTIKKNLSSFLKRLEQMPGVTKYHKEFLSRFMNSLYIAFAPEYSLMYSDETSRQAKFLTFAFENLLPRYTEHEMVESFLVKKGIKYSNQAKYSFLSNEANYQQLRYIFLNHTSYVLSDIFNPNLYQSAAIKDKLAKANSVLYSSSNVFTVQAGLLGEAMQDGISQSYIDLVKGNSSQFCQDKHFLRCIGNTFPHNFELRSFKKDTKDNIEVNN